MNSAVIWLALGAVAMALFGVAGLVVGILLIVLYSIVSGGSKYDHYN